MSLNNPPLIKSRKSRLNGADFSSSLHQNSSNNFFQHVENSHSNDIDEQFSNFLNSNVTGSISDLKNSSHKKNNQFLTNSNNKYTESSNFDFNIIKRHRKKATIKEEISDNTNKRPPITPRKTLNPQELQTHLNENGIINNHFHSETNRSNPFIVKNTKSKEHSNGKKRMDEFDPNKSFIDYDAYKVLRSVFSYENRSVDLELDQNIIRIKPTNDSEKLKKRPPELEIDLNKVYSVMPTFSIANSNRNDRNPSDDFVNGFELHMFEIDKPNIYKHKSLLFKHPHRETCQKWLNKITEFIPTIQNERHVVILLNPYSGQKYTRAILNQKILPLLKTAQLRIQIIEFHDKLPLIYTLYQNNINLNNFYGIIVMAGDGSLSKVINTMIELEAYEQENLNLCNINEIKNRLRTPLCIIPCGSTNMFANSIYGTDDAITPLMYLFYGISIRVDLSSVYTSTDKLHSFGFGYSCGFGSTIARYLNRYSKLGQNKVQTSLARGVAKQKHRLVEVEIHYLKDTTNQPCDENLCVRGCDICGNFEKNLNLKKTIDQVEEFDPIENSIEEIKRNISYKNDYGEWEIIRGSFTHIAFLSNACLWEHAPGGLSKYGHLADGCIDLILVDKVSRKDFYRYIKRHTNQKNQLNLPFVKTLRIKEAKIKILNFDKTSNPMNKSVFTEDSLSSFASNSTSNNFFKKSKSFSMQPNNDDKILQTSKRVNHFQFNSNNSSTGNNFTSMSQKNGNKTTTESFTIENEFSSDDSVKNSPVPTKKNPERIGSFRIKNSNATSLYFIKKNNNLNKTSMNSSYNAAYDDDDDDDDIESNNRTITDKSTKKDLRVDLPRRSSLIRKSQSFLNLLGLGIGTDSLRIKKTNNFLNQSNTYTSHDFNDEKNLNGSGQQSPVIFNGFPGKSKNNFVNSAAFKSPSVWNCDWNLNNIPEMHIKCNKQFLPVFASGIDQNTVYVDSTMKSCFPTF